jgi:hypothetical protein
MIKELFESTSFIVLFGALAYIVYLRERYYFSIVCTFKKAIDIFEVKIDAQKGALRLEKKMTIDVLVTL